MKRMMNRKEVFQALRNLPDMSHSYQEIFLEHIRYMKSHDQLPLPPSQMYRTVHVFRNYYDRLATYWDDKASDEDLTTIVLFPIFPFNMISFWESIDCHTKSTKYKTAVGLCDDYLSSKV